MVHADMRRQLDSWPLWPGSNFTQRCRKGIASRTNPASGGSGTPEVLQSTTSISVTHLVFTSRSRRLTSSRVTGKRQGPEVAEADDAIGAAYRAAAIASYLTSDLNRTAGVVP